MLSRPVNTKTLLNPPKRSQRMLRKLTQWYDSSQLTNYLMITNLQGIFRNSTDPRSTQLLNASSLSASQESHAAANNENMLVNSTQYGQGVIELIKQIERSQGPDTNSQEDSFAACECGINLLHEKIEFQLARTVSRLLQPIEITYNLTKTSRSIVSSVVVIATSNVMATSMKSFQRLLSATAV
jgi:hypothetical protein